MKPCYALLAPAKPLHNPVQKYYALLSPARPC